MLAAADDDDDDDADVDDEALKHVLCLLDESGVAALDLFIAVIGSIFRTAAAAPVLPLLLLARRAPMKF